MITMTPEEIIQVIRQQGRDDIQRTVSSGTIINGRNSQSQEVVIDMNKLLDLNQISPLQRRERIIIDQQHVGDFRNINFKGEKFDAIYDGFGVLQVAAENYPRNIPSILLKIESMLSENGFFMGTTLAKNPANGLDISGFISASLQDTRIATRSQVAVLSPKREGAWIQFIFNKNGKMPQIQYSYMPAPTIREMMAAQQKR